MKRLFESTKINGVELDNRLVRSATWEGMADSDGRVTEPLVEVYRELADGGVGLIVTGYMAVRPEGRQAPSQLLVDSDARIPGLARIADAVHQRGGKVVAQIVHCGGQASREASGCRPLAPSAVPSPGYPELPRALSSDDINTLVASFAIAARRIQEAGFDGVQLHGAHGYLLAQFLSPVRNRRRDRWGGSLENRARFALAVTRAVRTLVGPRWPVMIKLNGNDFLPGSTTEEDAAFLARELVDAGIDAIEVSGGTGGSGPRGAVRSGIEKEHDEAYFLPQARHIRATCPEIPLILVGGIRSPRKMESLLASNAVDYLAMSRPLIREPHLPRRWRSGDLTRSACASCSGCFTPARAGEGVRCVKLDSQPRKRF